MVRHFLWLGAAITLVSGCHRGEAGLSASSVLAEGPLTIDVTGDQYNWIVRYPGGDGQHETDDDRYTLRHVHVPADTDVTLRLFSRDYVYTLSLPHLKLREIAVPDLVFKLAFRTGQPGTFALRGDQMCGFSHSNLIGTLIVENRDALVAWLRQQSTTPPAPEPTEW